MKRDQPGADADAEIAPSERAVTQSRQADNATEELPEFADEPDTLKLFGRGAGAGSETSGWADALGVSEDAQKQIYNQAMARLFGSAPGEPEPKPAKQEPERIGRFELLRKIGVGGMGIVYLARDPDLGRDVALKLLRAREGDAVATKRMRREARAMAKLAHPNVVHIHEVGTHADQLYLAMEYVDGPTLREWLHQQPHTWQEIVELFGAAGRGLQAAHDAGIVHRDFKPENVLITQGGLAKVTDFGLARDTDQPHASLLVDINASEDPALTSGLYTETGTIMGTPSYMAPEQFLAKSTDPRSDQFSFCVTLFEALVGMRPYAGSSYAELAENVLEGNRIELPSTSVPVWVLAALERGLHPDRDQRFASMRELLAALSGESASTPDIEEALDQARLEEYRRRARNTGLLIIAGQLIYILLDYTRAGLGELFFALLATRSSSLILASFAVIRPGQTLTRVRRDAILATAGMAASYVVVNLLYTSGNIHSATMINWVWATVLVLLNYSYPPHHIRTAAWISTLLSVGFVASEYAFMWAEPTTFASSLVALLTINVASFLLARQLHRNRRAEVHMLEAMIPSQVIARVVQGSFEVETFAAATVLYADLAGLRDPQKNVHTSTSSFQHVSGEIEDHSDEQRPHNPVAELLFAEFEILIRRFGIERVHNCRDGLLVICGAPTARPDHCQVMGDFALALQALARDFALADHGLTLRIGMDSGPLQASTIGRAQQLYDAWGDTVDIAKRLQSHSQTGDILVSQHVHEQLASEFRLVRRGDMWMPEHSGDQGIRTCAVASLLRRK